MQSKNGIGKEWANEILKRGYVADNKEPNKTKAKIWNQKAAVFETIELTTGNTFKFKGGWRGDMIK